MGMNVLNSNDCEIHNISSQIPSLEALEDKNNVYHYLELENSSNNSKIYSDEDDSKLDYRPVCKKRCLTDSSKVNRAVSNITEEKDEKKSKRCPQVAYIHSQELMLKANDLIRIEGRAQLVHALISTYGILQYINVIPPRSANEPEILGFHSSDYLKCLQDISVINDCDEVVEHSKSDLEGFGLSYDCPLQKDLFETASLISGASLTAAQQLLDGSADIAINWYGGWHHAKRDAASGFCYLNDIVLCILKLREKFDKVLYVDIDLHHGDGVEEAFSTTCKVMTVSFHKMSPGFFPGSGDVDDIGTGRGKYFTVNVPLMDGIKDKEYFSIFTRVMKQVKEKFAPDAVVMQCGADTLSDDPMVSFNLTHLALAKCVCYILTWNLPTVLLGGGGYNFPNTARCWTFLTALAAGKKLPVDIPEHEYLLDYGPSYELTTSPGNKKNCNTDQYLTTIVNKIEKNLSNIVLS